MNFVSKRTAASPEKFISLGMQSVSVTAKFSNVCVYNGTHNIVDASGCCPNSVAKCQACAFDSHDLVRIEDGLNITFRDVVIHHKVKSGLTSRAHYAHATLARSTSSIHRLGQHPAAKVRPGAFN